MEELRMYCLVRTDLKDVPTAKWMVQAGHAFAQCLVTADSETINAYSLDPKHAKIVLKAPDRETLIRVAMECSFSGIPHHLVTDLGLTVFKEPTTTCLGIGPITRETAKQIGISELTLYK